MIYPLAEKDFPLKIMAGDEQAYNDLLNYCRCFIGHLPYCSYISEDIVQDTMISVMESISIYDSQKSKFVTWVSVILMRRAMDYLRSEKKRKKRELIKFYNNGNSLINKESEIERIINEDEARFKIEKIFRNYDSERKSFVIDASLRDMSEKNLSIIYRLKRGTVKSRKHQALKILRERL